MKVKTTQDIKQLGPHHFEKEKKKKTIRWLGLLNEKGGCSIGPSLWVQTNELDYQKLETS